MATDIHFKIRAYLRQHGKTDMSKYQLGWANGKTTMGRWSYDDVAAPSDALLAAVPQAHLDFESEIPQTRDIYRSTIRSIADTSAVATLSPMRMPNITSQGTSGSVQLPAGLYKFIVVGHRPSSGNIPFELMINSTTNSIRRQVITTSEFDLTAVKLWGRETVLTISISLISRSGVNDLNLQITLIIERLQWRVTRRFTHRSNR